MSELPGLNAIFSTLKFWPVQSDGGLQEERRLKVSLPLSEQEEAWAVFERWLSLAEQVCWQLFLFNVLLKENER